MYLDTAYKLFKTLSREDQFFTYQGEFSDQITSMIISLVEENLCNKEGVAKLKNKVSFIMVESFQNIIRHAEPTDSKQTNYSESFQVRNIDNTFYITSSNLVKNERIGELRGKLDKLNTLDRKELKLLYMDSLDKNGLSEKGGAGLGLIEMARKSGQKLLYEFVPANDDASYFYLQSSLSNTNKEATDGTEEEKPLPKAMELHRMLSEKGIFVMNKGNFSHEAIKPILNMVESNLISQIELKTGQKILFHFLVELLQNISNHSYITEKGTNEGIFFMGQSDRGYFITAGNYIANEKIEELKTSIDLVNNLSEQELKSMYKQKLRSGVNERNKGAGIGLIDLARFSKERLRYKVFDVDEKKSFFSITVID